ALEARFELEAGEGPLFAVISRLTWQKGMDVLGLSLDALVASGARIAVLGTGEAAIEGMFRGAAARQRGRLGVIVGYDEPLAHLLQRGAARILITSRFEPCGLTQFCGLRYGSVPVVAHVGGLADTIVDANEAAVAAGAATGFQFAPVDADGLAGGLRRAMALYRDRKAWRALQKRGMKTDVSWTRSAARYAALYRDVARAHAV